MGQCISRPRGHNSQVSSSQPSEQSPDLNEEESFSSVHRSVALSKKEISAPLASPESSDIGSSQSINAAYSLTPTRSIGNLRIVIDENDSALTVYTAECNLPSTSSSSQNKSTPSPLSGLCIGGVLVEIPKNKSKQGRIEVKDKNSPDGVEHTEIDFEKTTALEKTKREWEEEKKKDNEPDPN